ncbi:MAG: hypothetical protein DHS20C18_31330 [Saprospiraceae bacterium]|nr:MAG: hypothetical protein DHS20C18_31330 [Saprospiraceae bacterium]
MRLTLLIVLQFLAVICGFAQYNLTVEIGKFKAHKGKVYVAVYNQETNFLDDDHIFRSNITAVDADKVTIQFSDLPQGQYAISLFHDANDNGEMDTNFFGAPKEDYGFSNNPKIWFRAPTFAEARIVVNADKKLVIKLK